MTPESPDSPNPGTNEMFVTTRWTQVAAARGESPEARQALSELCAAYYAPVVAFLRQEGRREDAARELAHEFFARVLQRPSFDRADPQRGRFRSYLLGALKHFLANWRVQEQRAKRGGEVIQESLDCLTDAASSADFIASASSPDAVFDREWAVNVLERAFAVLRLEFQQAGRLKEYEILKPWLTGGQGQTQSNATRQLGINEGAVRVAIHRLRRRFRELVRAEIAQTVHDPTEIVGELEYLIQALSY